MPKYAVRRGTNLSQIDFLKELKQRHPKATKIELKRVPKRKREYLFKDHYKIYITQPKQYTSHNHAGSNLNIKHATMRIADPISIMVINLFLKDSLG